METSKQFELIPTNMANLDVCIYKSTKHKKETNDFVKSK